MAPVSLTVENYLKEILLLRTGAGGPGRPVTTGRIALALGVAPATVTAMLKTLEEAGLVRHRPYGGVQLTRAGERLALRVQRRHRVVELFLVRVLGMSWTEVHEEAEALEHAVSEKVLERMDRILGRPTADPHGDPIPGPDGRVREAPVRSLASVPPGEPHTVVRLLEQSRGFLELAERLGLRPGAPVEVRERDEAGRVILVASGDRRPVPVALEAAERIVVRPRRGSSRPRSPGVKRRRGS